MISMTGYGYKEFINEDKKYIFELKTLNSKNLDVSIKLPNYLNNLEFELRNLIQNTLKRGSIFLNLNIENINKQQYEFSFLNYSNIVKIIEELNQIKKIYPNLNEYNSILSKNLIYNSNYINFNNEKISFLILNEYFPFILNETQKFREQEGKKLKNIIISDINLIKNKIGEISILLPIRDEELKLSLKEKIKNSLIDTILDENRFEQEILYFINKLDIQEEIIRFNGHFDYFIEVINSEDEQKGKKLSFILQEILREINTIGSKSNNIKIQKIIVDCKTYSEKIKEQLLNVL